MSTKEIKEFKKTVLTFYQKQGRHTLPWRKTKDPYRIFVSELMLQQTQVERVIPKYELFLKRFPDIFSLARAKQEAVLKLWSGLGYNRRARFLHQSAQLLVRENGGVFPKTKELLQKLPGVGEYTASAIIAFAYNKPVLLIETNVRTVFIHHFFKHKKDVSDKAILAVLEKTLGKESSRIWYAALMDYGSYLKSQGNKMHQRSKEYVKQTTFKGSRRELRGYVLKTLAKSSQTYSALQKSAPKSKHSLSEVLTQLSSEGFIQKKGSLYILI